MMRLFVLIMTLFVLQGCKTIPAAADTEVGVHKANQVDDLSAESNEAKLVMYVFSRDEVDGGYFVEFTPRVKSESAVAPRFIYQEQ